MNQDDTEKLAKSIEDMGVVLVEILKEISIEDMGVALVEILKEIREDIAKIKRRLPQKEIL